MANEGTAEQVLGSTNVFYLYYNPSFQDVADKYDPSGFGEQLVEANVDSIYFVAKDIHGHAYYETDIGTRHPRLDFDLIEEVVEACHARDINVIAYYSAGLDRVVGQANEDWLQHNLDGEKRKPEPESYDPTQPNQGWYRMCLNTPYRDEYVHPQVRELLEYDLDGFWFDVLSYRDDLCGCRYCRAAMRRQGLDPTGKADARRHQQHVRETFAEKTTRLIKAHDDDRIVCYNHPNGLEVTTALSQYMDFIPIEAHPGEDFNYWQTLLFARYGRNLDCTIHIQTGSSHRGWGDFGTVKSEPQLAYEAGLTLAHHMPLCIVDDLVPSAALDENKYDVIGSVFEEMKDLELPPARPVRDIAVVYPGDPNRGGVPYQSETNGALGATKLLCDTHQQFDLLDQRLAREQLGEFDLVVLPETGELRTDLVEQLREFVEGGGDLVVSMDTTLSEDGLELSDVLGVRYTGSIPYSTAYMQFENYTDRVPEQPMVSYDGFADIEPTSARGLGSVVAPTAARGIDRDFCHRQAPPGSDLGVPAATVNEFGDGRALYVGTTLFSQYFEFDYHGHRTLLDVLLGEANSSRYLDVEAPASVHVNAMRADDDVFVHATSYHANLPGNSIPRIEPHTSMDGVDMVVNAPDIAAVTPVTDVKVAAETTPGRVKMTLDDLHQHEIVRLSR